MVFTEKQDIMRQLFRQFAQTEFTDELLDRLEETGEFDWDIHKKMARYGFMGVKIPVEYGGQGADSLAYAHLPLFFPDGEYDGRLCCGRVPLSAGQPPHGGAVEGAGDWPLYHYEQRPALFHAILSRPDFHRWDASSLRTGFIGGSLYAPAMFQEIDESFGPQFSLLSSLGQTDATAGITAAHVTDPLEVRAAAVGRFMDHIEGKIVDSSSGLELPSGENGEVRIRGYNVMQGYYGDPEATAKAVDMDGWLSTGDMGWLDDAGYLHLTGRLKDLIIRGGENISPAEIEAVLANTPGLQTYKVVGVPDAHYGEVVCLCVVPEYGAALSEERLRDHLRRRLADFKLPAYIVCLDELPKTVTGKVLTSQLQALARERLGL